MKLKKLVATVAAIGVLSTGGVVFADALSSPAEIASQLTGKTVEEVTAERVDGTTYGTIADEAGVLDEFKTQILEQKKSVLDERVAENRLTQEEADEIYNNIATNQEDCDGTGSAAIGKNNGAGFGQGNGMSNGNGAGMQNGNGLRDGSGAGMQNGNGMGFGRAN